MGGHPIPTGAKTRCKHYLDGDFEPTTRGLIATCTHSLGKLGRNGKIQLLVNDEVDEGIASVTQLALPAARGQQPEQRTPSSSATRASCAPRDCATRPRALVMRDAGAERARIWPPSACHSLAPHSVLTRPHSVLTHSGRTSLQGHAAWPLKRTLRRAALQWHSTGPLE